MKKYIYGIIALLILSLTTIVIIQSQKIKSCQENISSLTTNVKAYSEENSKLKERNIEFNFTIDQLNYLNDSLVTEMNNVRRKLKIKDKEIQRLGYIASTANRVDTLILVDTLFKETMPPIDTVISDKDGWYNCNIGLRYPNEIIVNPSFKSEKYIITSVKKETVNPPKKCWLARLFQKKHNVIEVEVVENNPYIVGDKEKFVTVN